MNLPRGLYGITSRDFGFSHIEAARFLLNAGVKILQYREKEGTTRKMLEEALIIKNMCREYGALFIVNDRMDVAIASDADGIHIGQDDMPLHIVKKYFHGIIGVSARNLQEAFEAQRGGANYLGVGSIFMTGTKKDSEVIGIEKLEEIVNNVQIPIYAIGGINLQNLKEIKKYKIQGIAVISAILSSENPEKMAKKFIEEWEK